MTIDPAPRSYPPFVTLLRRIGRSESDALPPTTIAAVEEWLLGESMDQGDLLPLFESLIWRLIAAGLPIDRASLHVGTLHPQLFGFAWNWSRLDGLCDEVKVAEGSLDSDAYKRNPLYRVIEHGESFHTKLGEDGSGRYPLLADLAAQGFTEYIALPLRAGGAYHNAATVSTKQAGGFTETQLAQWRGLLRIFALHVERHIALRIAGNVMDAYLGTAAGGQVLRGSIKRGAGEAIRAIIWVSDMRGFTDKSGRLDGPDMIALLNAYFERLAGAVMEHGGEVLKFIGDGLLAVFPYAAFADEKAAAEASLTAAETALKAVQALTDAPPEALARVEGWRPLRTGIALHEGNVFFGNVGAPERLDFTVIGRAVNAASRVEALSKTLGRAILITEPVARLLDCDLEDLGPQSLRGVAEPMWVFSPLSCSISGAVS